MDEGQKGSYDADGPGGLPAERVVTTAPHPFWVADAGGFVAAAELKPGDDLRLAGGGIAEVVSVGVEYAPAGTNYTTYNFAVADFHTYFVGEDGVWVHNAGNAACQRLLSLAKWYKGQGLTPQQAFKRIEDLFPTMDAKTAGQAPDEFMRKEVRPGTSLPDPLFTKGVSNDPLVNMWEDHYLKHRAEFPDIDNAVAYVERALDFTDNSTRSGTIRVGVINFPAGHRQRIVWDSDPAKNWFGIAELEPDGTRGSLQSLYVLDRAKIPSKYATFEEYFLYRIRGAANEVL